MSRQRLVRRKPLFERVKDYLNPGDFLLYLSEEIETRDWDSKHLANSVALGLHTVLLIARANTGASAARGSDDVFGDDQSGAGWLNYISTFIVYLLTIFSAANAAYTFHRTRHYRLFERAVDAPQSTPSAYRVRVDSSPVSSSPLRFFTSILGDPSAESRAHPDPTRDVWEISVWDPLPVCIRLFGLFSPGHVLVYWLFLPTLSSDPRPSMTVFTTLVLEVLVSSQLILLQTAFTQQEKDLSIIHQEVMSEYDIKYVHPRLNPVVRDVGTQFNGPLDDRGNDSQVDTYTPAVVLKRGFQTHPNPNYAQHIDPDGLESITRSGMSLASGYTPSAYNSRDSTPFANMTPRPPIRQPQFRKSMANPVSTGASDGGSLGVYSHANSPLKKAASMYDIQANTRSSPRNSVEMAALEIRDQKDRSQSPAKRLTDAHRMSLGHDNDRRTSAPGGLVKPKPGPGQYNSTYNRMPSRFNF
ncbi:hypothetical protein BJ875DRAFT_388177 [Amylocarpus encephaloides]|uniref:Meiotically up-regulated gene 154 protein n=1 Tax=Amylocarpus encephaloides TaxID=45428 RepID=A0A9P7Y8E4_9HELO|nr:hypothetical protein BJ875DRAFT_388177 [Amylocarpus encephaloides]